MISIIIPTYNEEKNIASLLSQLQKQVSKDDEILIVDSKSTDATVRIAKKFSVRVLNMEKLGIGVARTHGANYAKNPVIAFLDADSEISENWLNKMKIHFQDKELEALGGLDLYKYSNLWENIMYNTYTWKIFLLGFIAHKLTGNFWVPSNNGAFRKDIFLNMGGYKPFLCEDFEFTKRFRPKKATYDYSMIVMLSDRRFKQDGFFKTILFWAKSDVKALLNIDDTRKAVNYRK